MVFSPSTETNPDDFYDQAPLTPRAMLIVNALLHPEESRSRYVTDT